jgi:hypothetical protein
MSLVIVVSYRAGALCATLAQRNGVDRQTVLPGDVSLRRIKQRYVTSEHLDRVDARSVVDGGRRTAYINGNRWRDVNVYLMRATRQ